MSSFPGHPPKAPEAPKPLRTFTYKSYGGGSRTVVAHYLQFMTEHVTFWIEREGDTNQLVLAETNKNVHGLKEVSE